MLILSELIAEGHSFQGVVSEPFTLQRIRVSQSCALIDLQGKCTVKKYYVSWLLYSLLEASIYPFRYPLLGNQLISWEPHPLISYLRRYTSINKLMLEHFFGIRVTDVVSRPHLSLSSFYLAFIALP